MNALEDVSRAQGAEDAWVIEPVGLGVAARLREFWQYRRLLWFLSVRAVRMKYERTTLGIFWLFARPLLPILISTFIFGGLLGLQGDGLPYFLFFLAGTGIWHFFERALLWVTRGLEQNRGLIKKMYFPRLIAPMSAVMPAFTDLGIYMALLLVGACYYAWRDGRWYLALGAGSGMALVSVLVATLLALGVGLFTSVWQVKHREIRYSIRYVARFWFYLTPVIYPMSQVPAHLRWVIYLNPMAAVVETYKWSVLGVGVLPLAQLGTAALVTSLLLVLGVWYFLSSEAASVDDL